ncbi:MAG: S8 family serine peptidase [Paludibacter sp.]|nr:S8 family serine peptidase [Paludibacter sp.]
MKTKFTPSINFRLLFVLLFVFLISESVSAVSYYFYVQLTNKNNSPYSLSNPSEFLSPKAIARRADFNIGRDSTDLPVNPAYIAQISNLGIMVHSRSKWMNGVTVLVSDSNIMSQVRTLPFVKRVQYTGKIDTPSPVSKKMKFQADSLNYGSATTQINQVNGTFLHNQGYTGKNITVGVLDAGFYNVNINPGFDSLRLSGRLLGTKDIAEPNSNIYALDTHGANVLSIMTGNLPAQYLGTAPHASFWLIRTEVVPTEYLVETDFWVSGIEFADSVGVDVVNSSLGYTQYDDPTMNFTYADMNGLVSRASRAATIAAEKGIIVCTSAGNEGTRAWRYISSPADADKILSVGSVTSTGSASSFSSYGPTYDERIKPEVCAMGSSTAYIFHSGVPTWGSGTSYSSPVIAGMMACFLQYIKANRSVYFVEDILQSVIRSGNRYGYPDPQMGYGIPNFQVAAANLPTYNGVNGIKSDNMIAYVDNSNKMLRIKLLDDIYLNGHIHIYTVTGQLFMTKKVTNSQMEFNISKLHQGIYLVSITNNGFVETHKIIIEK